MSGILSTKATLLGAVAIEGAALQTVIGEGSYKCLALDTLMTVLWQELLEAFVKHFAQPASCSIFPAVCC